MTTSAESYRRMRDQVSFLLNVVELLASSIDRDSTAARVARQVVDLVKTAITATEKAANVYAGVAAQLADLLARVERLKADGRPPSHVEWESLRADMDLASRQIAAALSEEADEV